MKHADVISGVFWLALGILVTLWSASYQVGNILDPGPGFYPLGLGLLMVLFSLIQLAGQARRSSTHAEEIPRLFAPGGWAKIGYTVVILLLATFLFEVIGYLVTIFFFLVFLMLGQELRSWKKVLFIAILTTLGVYVVFVRLLEQPLPRGFMGI